MRAIALEKFGGAETAATLTSGADGTETTLKTIERLEQLAGWHRFNADHAGSAWIWDARLRTAEDFERQAAQLRALLLPRNRIRTGEARPSP